ncbi:MAG: HD domain-containing protein, partial [Heliobacteriaceae bacterium]|nr:HD domain-containing protein [Heliobacteriaceae bacterium]
MNIPDEIKKFNNEIYLVGGAVRDFYMGKQSTDFDLIVTDEDARDFAQKIEGTFVPLDEQNKIYRVVTQLSTIDVTNPVGGSLERDLMRRDLTMNAIAMNIKTGEIIDLCGGVADIRNKCINMISEQNFVDDPLRLLRVYRFQATLGFAISADTVAAVCKHANLIHEPAVERVNYELLRLFGREFAHTALVNMDTTWLLEEIFQFVKELKQIPPNTHHHLDLFNHSIEVVRQIQQIYENSASEVREHLERVDFGGLPRLAHLKLAGFLHDMGKFSTWTIEEDRHRFIKHDDVGAKLAASLLKKMKFSSKQTEYISLMVKNHLYPAQLVSEPDLSDKTMMRFVRKLDENAIDNIILSQADRLSACGEAVTDAMVEQNINKLNDLMKFYLDSRETLEPLPKLLSGHEVMEILNIKPSRALGEIMKA